MKNNKSKKNRQPMERTIDKPKDFKKSFKDLFQSLKPYYAKLVIIFVFAVLGTIFTIVGPKILGNATTEIYNGIIAKINGVGSINFKIIQKILITMLILYLISSLFNYIQGIIMARISASYSKDLRSKINNKITKLPIKYFDDKTHGETLSLVTNDVDCITMNLNRNATEVISSLSMIIGILVMMFSINVGMTLITIVILPLSIIISALLMGKSQNHFKNAQNKLATVNGNVEEMFSGHVIIKAFNAENKMLNKFNKENYDLCDSVWKSNFLSGLMHPIMTLIGNIGYVVVAILGGINVVKGRITVGNIQSFITYTKNFTNPIGELTGCLAELQSMFAASERIFEFLSLEEENNDGVLKLDLNKFHGNVEFKNVTFGYEKDNIIINNFNACVKEGKKIAIVGPTGAGKTTLVKLLMRFYDLNDGEIFIDNENIVNYSKEELRSAFAMVLQDAWLFSGTIKENIRYGKLDASDEDVINACKVANVDHFIRTLSDGYDTVITEDANNISGGQKQLLTIARAILSNPKILILDEATSSVDTRTEELIQKAMDNLMKNRTSFIIAHRLSTIKNADLILVLDKGDVVEQGTHEELINKNGFYAKLYNSQFENI